MLDNFLSSIKEGKFGRLIDTQRTEIQKWLNVDENSIFVISGTFGSNDKLDFSCLPGKFICDITTRNPSTERLFILFYAVYVRDLDMTKTTSVLFVCNKRKNI